MKCKTLHLLRHAVAVHNQPEAAAKLPPEALFDPGLTAQGFAQAQALRPLVKSLGPQLVVTSPLTRALQTAVAVLDGAGKNGAGGGEASGASRPSPEAGVGAGPGATPPIVAVEAVREAYGQFLPDKRRSRAELMAAFSPPVDMSGLPEGDTLWTPRRETLDSVLSRARTFVWELLRRPERRVLVVSHGVFLQCVLQELLGGGNKGAGGAATSPDGSSSTSSKYAQQQQQQQPAHPDYNPSRPVLNCELYTVILVEMDGRFLLNSFSPGHNPHLLSPPVNQYLQSPPGEGLAGAAATASAIVQQLLVTPGTHELLASSGLPAEVCMWIRRGCLVWFGLVVMGRA